MEKSCPISTDKVDITILRLENFFMVIHIGLIATLPDPYQLLFTFGLIYEFWVRSRGKINYSLFYIPAKTLMGILKQKPRYTDSLSKQFAALLGLFLSMCIFVFSLFEWGLLLHTLLLMLIFCIVLEAFLGVCIGCKVYYILQNMTQWRKP